MHWKDWLEVRPHGLEFVLISISASRCDIFSKSVPELFQLRPTPFWTIHCRYRNWIWRFEQFSNYNPDPGSTILGSCFKQIKKKTQVVNRFKPFWNCEVALIKLGDSVFRITEILYRVLWDEKRNKCREYGVGFFSLKTIHLKTHHL